MSLLLAPSFGLAVSPVPDIEPIVLGCASEVLPDELPAGDYVEPGRFFMTQTLAGMALMDNYLSKFIRSGFPHVSCEECSVQDACQKYGRTVGDADPTMTVFFDGTVWRIRVTFDEDTDVTVGCDEC